MHRCVSLVAWVSLPIWLWAGTAASQEPKIWTVELGTHVSNLPAEYVIQACGTNGGPPSLPLDGFGEFERCPVEADTGLREVWFSFDDEVQQIYRALRIPEEEAGHARANQLFGHPVILSLLIDDDSLVQGYRVVSDSREPPEVRINADVVANPLKLTVFGFGGWTCRDLPRIKGEGPFTGRFIKESCEKISEGRWVRLETRLYSKPGQQAHNPALQNRENQFEASVRLEVLNVAWMP